MKVVGADASQISNIDLFTSHEALILPYEEALTRKLPDPDTREMKWYNTSAHFIWIGDRTRQIDGAHVEYFSGIENPIGIKCGPSMDPEELSRLLDIVNPNKEIGKVTLITRYGCNLVDEHLPKHIKAVQDSGHVVVWACDPMHGNTEQSSSGVKTRNFRNIIQEISRSFSIHLEYGRTLNGVHLEMTGDSVTECVGGFMELDHHHLSQNYQTSCDPRLNYEQSLDVALLIAKYNERKRRGSMGMM
ncbi:hypothetical protein K7432_015188 [Basidiobolus ranarum]|uniref:Phospho-2-dehydro-3-deoxyheptonate aldolase n=1 Tax=Basidiobolus ranarum TaxID=34480 RepID=A0ABR2WGI7_9FUNG